MAVYGVDLSHWDGIVDYLQLRVNGVVKFCLLKATEGATFVDSKFAANKAGCQSIGMPWGAYHFFRPAEDPILQARHFFQTVGAGCYVYVIDVEIPGSGLGAKVKAFIDELKRLGAPTVAIYTGPYFWRDNVGNDVYFKAFELWIANYGVNQPMIPLPWTAYKIWQFSDKGSVPGIPAAVDENWFNGDVNAMLAYFKNGGIPQPLPSIVRVTANSLYVRDAPMGRILGSVKNGWLLGVDGSQLYGNVKWFRIGTGFVSSEWVVEA